MNKNRLFLISMVAVSLMLFLLSVTGQNAHNAVAVVGLVVMIGFTVATRKEWKSAGLEVVMRIAYLLALITGGVLLNAGEAGALGMVHRISAALFAVLLLILYIPKK